MISIIHNMNYRRLDLNLLPLFESLLSERHVSRAAARSGISQPAMSHALSRLRRMLDDPILIRGKSGMQPTPAALRLAPLVRDILTRAEALAGRTGAFEPQTCDRTFILGTTDYAASRLLPAIGAEMSTVAPKARLVVRHIGRSEGIRAVESGDVDIAIGTFPGAHRLRSQILSEERYLCAVWKGNQQVKTRISLAQYLKLSHVLVEARGDPEGVVDFELNRRNLRRHIVCVVPYFLMAPALIRGTDLILTLSEGVLRDQIDSAELKLMPPPLSLPKSRIELLWHERDEKDAAMRWFRGIVVKNPTAGKGGG